MHLNNNLLDSVLQPKTLVHPWPEWPEHFSRPYNQTMYKDVAVCCVQLWGIQITNYDRRDYMYNGFVYSEIVYV